MLLTRALSGTRALPCLLAATLWVPAAAGEETGGLRTLTPEELERYEFEVEETQAIVRDLSLGQRYVLSAQRREIADLAARRLGVPKLRGDRRDLEILQGLVDRKAIRIGDVREWQGLGVVFGDILAHEFGLRWVSYEDDLGVSKALRWRDTENYVFPVTIFSKRVGFDEKIQVAAIFDKLVTDIKEFKAREARKPEFD